MTEDWTAATSLHTSDNGRRDLQNTGKSGKSGWEKEWKMKEREKRMVRVINEDMKQMGKDRMEYRYGTKWKIGMKNEPQFGRKNHGKRGAIINTISYKKKLDSHIIELVAERNKERHVNIHAKQTFCYRTFE